MKTFQELIALETSGLAEPTGTDKLRTPRTCQICTRTRAHTTIKVTLGLYYLGHFQEGADSYQQELQDYIHTCLGVLFGIFVHGYVMKKST